MFQLILFRIVYMFTSNIGLRVINKNIPADIDRMIDEAEKFKAEDNAQANMVKAREEVKNYCYQVLDTMENETLADKLKEEEQDTILEQCNEVLEWVEKNPEVPAKGIFFMDFFAVFSFQV